MARKVKQNGLEHGYTPEEIKTIKENFKKAFGISYGLIDGNLKGIANKHRNVMNNMLVVGRKFWHFVYKAQANELGLDDEGYTLIQITYIRGEVIFYKFIEATKNKNKEYHFEIGSNFEERLIPTEIHYDELSMLSKNNVLFQLTFSPRLAGKHIKVWDDEGNSMPDIVIDEKGYEIKNED